MARQIYFGLPVASDSRPFRGRTFATSSAVPAAGHGADGFRSFLFFRRQQRGVPRLHDYRHLRLLHCAERRLVDRMVSIYVNKFLILYVLFFFIWHIKTHVFPKTDSRHPYLFYMFLGSY